MYILFLSTSRRHSHTKDFLTTRGKDPTLGSKFKLRELDVSLPDVYRAFNEKCRRFRRHADF